MNNWRLKPPLHKQSPSLRDSRIKQILKQGLVFWTDASMPKKPGFLPNLRVSAKDFGKKTRFLTTRASRTILGVKPKLNLTCSQTSPQIQA